MTWKLIEPDDLWLTCDLSMDHTAHLVYDGDGSFESVLATMTAAGWQFIPAGEGKWHAQMFCPRHNRSA